MQVSVGDVRKCVRGRWQGRQVSSRWDSLEGRRAAGQTVFHRSRRRPARARIRERRWYIATGRRPRFPGKRGSRCSVGRYSTISPSGVGTKAGTIRPMPFSIQMPTIDSTQASVQQASGSARRAAPRAAVADRFSADGRPDPRHQGMAPVQAEVKVAGGGRRAANRCRTR